MTLSLQPFYLPREFNKIIITVAYIPPGVDVKLADHYLCNVVCKMEMNSPDAVKILKEILMSVTFEMHTTLPAVYKLYYQGRKFIRS